MKLLERKLSLMGILCGVFLSVATLHLYANCQVMFEIIAGEGISFTDYQSDDIDFEPHEFPEFNHEIGVNTFLFRTYNCIGIGLCLGCIYNLYGASSAYIDNPTLKYMLHWLKLPLLVSFSVIRNSSVMHFDIGMYGSFFLVGEKIWRDTQSGIDVTTKLTRRSIYDDCGVRAQVFIDMGLISLKNGEAEIAGGLGLTAEKSLLDICKETSVEMNSFRLGVCLALSLLRNPQYLRKIN
jgi:hypothetical protein